MKRWLLFIISIILMGVWFPVSFFRKDERTTFFKDNFGLNTKLGHLDGDSVEEAYQNIGKSDSLPHSLKNILHEWTKENPKRAAKFLSFIIVIQSIFISIVLL